MYQEISKLEKEAHALLNTLIICIYVTDHGFQIEQNLGSPLG